MKKMLSNAAILVALLFIAFSSKGQKVLKVGETFDINVQTTKRYQAFKSSSTDKTIKQVVFQKEFYSQNSSYVKLYFEGFDLAPGDYIAITGKESGEVLIYGGKGKIVDQQGTMISNFWSRVLFDERVEVKLYSSGNVGYYKGFSITKVAYGYSNDKINQILDTNAKTNSICSSDNKERIACYEGTEMFNKGKAVARLLINGSSLCTGWLLGSEGHLMTNNHCIGSSSAANNTDFIFDYQHASCTGSATLPSNVVAESATLIKTSSSLDYTLVRLPVNPTNTYGYLSLSPNAPSVGDRIYIPQHPGGRLKEIAVTADGNPATVNCTGNCGSRSTTYFADTEGGSSGSPVIDYNTNEVIAIHNTGGCPNGSSGRCDQLISAIGSDMPANGIGDGTGGGGSDPDPDVCSSTVNAFPYSESFESGDGWTQATGDNGNWVRDANGTPSSNTGPSDAVNGSFYMYLEASSNGTAGEIGANATARLTSPCFDLSSVSTATFSFNYHMYGSNVGSLLLEGSTDGINWSSLWSESGNQGNQWNSASVNLRRLFRPI